MNEPPKIGCLTMSGSPRDLAKPYQRISQFTQRYRKMSYSGNVHEPDVSVGRDLPSAAVQPETHEVGPDLGFSSRNAIKGPARHSSRKPVKGLIAPVRSGILVISD